MGSSSTMLPPPDSDLIKTHFDPTSEPDAAPAEQEDTVVVCGHCWHEIPRNSQICPHCKTNIPKL